MAPSDPDPGVNQEEAFIEELAETEPEEAERGPRRRDLWGRRIRGTGASLASRRSTSRLVDTGFHAYERNKRIPLSLLASALAARIVIYAIPFMVLAVVTTGFYSNAYNTDPVEAARDAGMAGLLAEAVEDSTEASRGFRTVTLISMVVVTLWTADGLAKLVRRIHALVWATPTQRPRRRWMLPIVVIGLSIASLLVSRTGMEAQTWAAAVRAGELLVEVGIVAGIALVLSRYLPHDPAAHSWRHLLPGAVLFALGVSAMKAAMVFYLAPRAIELAERYDEVAAAVILLTWGYWIAFIIVFSAALNAAMFRSHQRSTNTA